MENDVFEIFDPIGDPPQNNLQQFERFLHWISMKLNGTVWDHDE